MPHPWWILSKNPYRSYASALRALVFSTIRWTRWSSTMPTVESIRRLKNVWKPSWNIAIRFEMVFVDTCSTWSRVINYPWTTSIMMRMSSMMIITCRTWFRSAMEPSCPVRHGIANLSFSLFCSFLGYFSQKFDRSLLSCLTNNTLRKHEQCLKTFQSNIQTVLLTRASLQEINKWSEDFLRCVYNSMPTHCSSATKEVFVFKELLAVKEKQNSSTPTALNITKIVKQQLPGQDVQGFAQSKRATSSIHGERKSSDMDRASFLLSF